MSATYLPSLRQVPLGCDRVPMSRIAYAGQPDRSARPPSPGRPPGTSLLAGRGPCAVPRAEGFGLPAAGRGPHGVEPVPPRRPPAERWRRRSHGRGAVVRSSGDGPPQEGDPLPENRSPSRGSPHRAADPRPLRSPITAAGVKLTTWSSCHVRDACPADIRHRRRGRPPASGPPAGQGAWPGQEVGHGRVRQGCRRYPAGRAESPSVRVGDSSPRPPERRPCARAGAGVRPAPGAGVAPSPGTVGATTWRRTPPIRTGRPTPEPLEARRGSP